ncbi:hypothetical protein ACFVXH_39495 [Kitasatospora sp. NPDC058184]|uniref:hypothetical protein n=1 Tax=Kitasatospora sp. NPDC058184 TaxID=3346370 RepID=UPI0036DC9473
MTLLHFPGPAGPRPRPDVDVDVDVAPSALAVERAAFAARAQPDPERRAEDERAEALERAELAAALEAAERATERAGAWVAELATRTGNRDLTEFAAAVLACGRDLDPEDGESGGVPAETTVVLDGFVLLGDGLGVQEGLVLAAVGAIALAMPRTITYGCPVTQLPRLAERLNQALAAGRTTIAGAPGGDGPGDVAS